ncbi:MAG: response regulator [Chloroflexi bacterium]|nr:response regulator [Chloroflexota bacterium]
MMQIPRAFVGWEVLVADDERDSLEVASRMLKIAGARVSTALNGKDAIAAFKANPDPVKFVITDLSMPDMDGWELLYLLQQERPKLPVIALTAHAMAGDRERGLTAGFHGYVTKPIDPMRFVQQLVSMLSQIPEYAPLLKAP